MTYINKLIVLELSVVLNVSFFFDVLQCTAAIYVYPVAITCFILLGKNCVNVK